jgi:flagellar basal-body rod protein FlgB
MSGLFDTPLELTGKVLDLRLQRQNLVTANISNINTPNYRPRRLEFEKALQSALDLDANGKMTRTTKGHMPSAFNAEGFAGRGFKDVEGRYVYGQDSVDLDKEMGELAKNNMAYDALTEIIRKKFDGLNKVIADGKA